MSSSRRARARRAAARRRSKSGKNRQRYAANAKTRRITRVERRRQEKALAQARLARPRPAERPPAPPPAAPRPRARARAPEVSAKGKRHPFKAWLRAHAEKCCPARVWRLRRSGEVLIGDYCCVLVTASTIAANAFCPWPLAEELPAENVPPQSYRTAWSKAWRIWEEAAAEGLSGPECSCVRFTDEEVEELGLGWRGCA